MDLFTMLNNNNNNNMLIRAEKVMKWLIVTSLVWLSFYTHSPSSTSQQQAVDKFYNSKLFFICWDKVIVDKKSK